MKNLEASSVIAYKFIKNLNEEEGEKGEEGEQSWFIESLIHLFNIHPALLKNITPKIKKGNISIIMTIIDEYFLEIQKIRKLKQSELFYFLDTNPQFRSLESLTLLLSLGFKFSNAYLRMKNSNKPAGEIISIEPNNKNVICRVDYEEILPYQIKNRDISTFYNKVCDAKTKSEYIESELKKLSEVTLRKNFNYKNYASFKKR